MICDGKPIMYVFYFFNFEDVVLMYLCLSCGEVQFISSESVLKVVFFEIVLVDFFGIESK